MSAASSLYRKQQRTTKRHQIGHPIEEQRKNNGNNSLLDKETLTLMVQVEYDKKPMQCIFG
jgi:hypothetical protein